MARHRIGFARMRSDGTALGAAVGRGAEVVAAFGPPAQTAAGSAWPALQRESDCDPARRGDGARIAGMSGAYRRGLIA